MSDGQLRIELPAITPIRGEVAVAVESAMALSVSSREEHEIAQKALLAIAERERKIEELFREPKRAAHQAHKAITEMEKALLQPLREARAIVARKCAEFEEKERRAAEERRKALEREAKRAEEERLLAEAIALEEEGRAEEARAILDREPAIQATAVVPCEPGISKVDGVQSRTIWRAEVVDFAAMVNYVAKNPQYLGLLEPSMPALNALARAQREGFSIPGCRAVRDVTKAVRVKV